MAEFPESPIAPKEFFESWLPDAFQASPAAEQMQDADMKLGVRIDGDGGGEWVFHIEKGVLSVRAEPRTDCSFTVIQTVEDWRGALWEGRGGAFGQQAVAMFKPGVQAEAARPGQPGGPPTPQALEQMHALDGVIRMQVTGGDGGDWAVEMKLGPGEIPAEPTTTVSVSSEDAEQMADGSLDPMQAFMSGRIQVAGDMAWMMQMQAIQMQAAAAAAAPPAKEG